MNSAAAFGNQNSLNLLSARQDRRELFYHPFPHRFSIVVATSQHFGEEAKKACSTFCSFVQTGSGSHVVRGRLPSRLRSREGGKMRTPSKPTSDAVKRTVCTRMPALVCTTALGTRKRIPNRFRCWCQLWAAGWCRLYEGSASGPASSSSPKSPSSSCSLPPCSAGDKVLASTDT